MVPVTGWGVDPIHIRISGLMMIRNTNIQIIACMMRPIQKFPGSNSPFGACFEPHQTAKDVLWQASTADIALILR